jgi:hypothetical protein
MIWLRKEGPKEEDRATTPFCKSEAEARTMAETMRKPKKSLQAGEDQRNARKTAGGRRKTGKETARNESRVAKEGGAYPAGMSLTRVVMMKRMRLAVITRMLHEIRRERLACKAILISSAGREEEQGDGDIRFLASHSRSPERSSWLW